ncbi:Nif3-like dinuclear metal center hexameric protein [Virgibacillus necropolis]|uniref:GTP cyclohydrolase 1 type 2 homolog n=1 Tax=Virgibacillus necropolis TaxID=163877 RepID=A0A221MC78_9BACI|nr:Nif3-like dinuclear metal center hexameric protein [Virgibacillus necropolis]ASN05209.1 Nif3-like dinuclear metal center hexameric protein [Virgibacillus necropolis]
MKSKIKNLDVFRTIEKWAPLDLAYDWDNIGLQVGSSTREVKKVMVTLDVLETVVDEAIEKEVDLIIAHHPLLFKPVKQINTDEVQGRVIQKLLNHNITVYAAHTNLDAADGGVNDMLCDAIGIKSTDLLIESKEETLYKLVVYVPITHVTNVRNALGDSGAGHAGNYSHCTFQTEGIGTFTPLAGTNPFIGEEGIMEHVSEAKVETIVSEGNLSLALDRMKEAHPYEEVAYDIITLSNEGAKFGIGRIGCLASEMTLQELSNHVKQALEVPTVRVTGDLGQPVKKIAVLGGSGEGYIRVAKEKGADVYLTGDMSFHTAQDAWQMGLSIIDPGHHVEKVMKQATKRYLKSVYTDEQLEVIISDSNTEPFQFV